MLNRLDENCNGLRIHMLVLATKLIEEIRNHKQLCRNSAHYVKMDTLYFYQPQRNAYIGQVFIFAYSYFVAQYILYSPR